MYPFTGKPIVQPKVNNLNYGNSNYFAYFVTLFSVLPPSHAAVYIYKLG